MEAGGTTWGAIKVYADNPGAYNARNRKIRFVDSRNRQRSSSATCTTARSAQRVGDDVKQTMRARDVIATATGMVMARSGLIEAHRDEFDGDIAALQSTISISEHRRKKARL